MHFCIVRWGRRGEGECLWRAREELQNWVQGTSRGNGPFCSVWQASVPECSSQIGTFASGSLYFSIEFVILVIFCEWSSFSAANWGYALKKDILLSVFSALRHLFHSSFLLFVLYLDCKCLFTVLHMIFCWFH